jgi:hypothetical protein
MTVCTEKTVVAILWLLGGIAPVAAMDDLETIRQLLATDNVAQISANRRAAESKITELLTNRAIAYSVRRDAVKIVADNQLISLIPLLIEQIDNAGQHFGSIKPWEETYTSVAGLLTLDGASVGPVFNAVIVEKVPLRRDLMLLTLLGILGQKDTEILLSTYGKSIDTEEAKLQMNTLVVRANALAPGAPGILPRDRPQTLPFPIPILQDNYKRPSYDEMIHETVANAVASHHMSTSAKPDSPMPVPETAPSEAKSVAKSPSQTQPSLKDAKDRSWIIALTFIVLAGVVLWIYGRRTE